MTDRGKFMVFCVEVYKNAKGLTGRQVSSLFSEYDVWDYVYTCFDALHTTGEKYIIDDIDMFIQARQ